MNFEAEHWYHIYNRGINQETVFLTRKNYLFFLHKVRKYWTVYCDLIAYCLMPNHFHFLVSTSKLLNKLPSTLNQKIGTVLSSYTQAINKQESRTGSLFQASTKAKPLKTDDRNYPLMCFHYIHQNPLRAGLVTELKDWPFSSYRDYAGLRNGTLPSLEAGFHAFGFNSQTDFQRKSQYSIESNLIKKLY